MAAPLLVKDINRERAFTSLLLKCLGVDDNIDVNDLIKLLDVSGVALDNLSCKADLESHQI